MKIRKLSISNVASIESAEIDFETGPLGEAPLFLICGETGSGKTTILDCITLALYGRTPRYEGKAVHNAQRIGGLAFNDARQLVRHGATSARAALSLIGNDGKPYVAEWSVEAVSRGANKGTLKPEAWSWKDASPGGITWTRVRDCEAVAQMAVGVGFEQFCRTTMLAQGQFTNFLLGTEDEKAQILEKLTDTSKYSRLGMEIARKYGRIDDAFKKLENEIGQLAGLGDERGKIENRIGELTAQIAELEGGRKAADAKLRWLQRRDELAANAHDIRSKLVVAFSELKAWDRKVDEDFQHARKELAALEGYLAANADRSAMYESAAMIVKDLEDVRKARKEKAAAEEARAECLKNLPGLAKLVDAANAALGKSSQDISDAEERIAAEEKALAALDRNGVLKAKGAEEKRRGDLQVLAERINGISKMEAGVADREKAVAKDKGEIAELKGRLPALKAAMDGAKDAADQARKKRDDQKKLVEDGIEKLVADLKVGDKCPICGNQIETLHARGHFTSLFSSLDEECSKAEKSYEEKKRRHGEVSASVDARQRTIEEAARQIESEKSRICKERAGVSECAERCGIQGVALEGVRAAIGACGERITTFNLKLEKIERQDGKVKKLQGELKALAAVREKARVAVVTAERNVESCKNQIERHDMAIAAADGRAKEKLAAVLKAVSIPGWIEKWEEDAEAVELAFGEEAKVYVAKKASLVKLEGGCAALENMKSRIADCIRRAESKVAALAEVACGEKAADSTTEMEGLLGRFDESASAWEKLAEARPDGLLETDTAEGLSGLCETLKQEVSERIEERGRQQQQIDADDKCSAERKAKRAEADRLKAERDEWAPIFIYFGDTEGKLIRRAIQSYVLDNVLVTANYYLRQLSDRYSLACEGLTLSVRDAFDGGAVRPVNTLSGGEQFLVSLALALGLSGMNDTGLGVDVLLIDEGFGTLSGEHLNTAIEALERLNALTGSRKVGVISHVERIRERIRVHVEVSRNGSDPSVVVVRSS